MAKVKDTVRFTSGQSNTKIGRNKEPLHFTLKQIEDEITAEPGIGVGEIGKRLGSTTVDDDGRIASRLYTSLRAKKPRFKRIKQDGRFRYYPINHLAGTERNNESELSVVDIPKPRESRAIIEPDENIAADELNAQITELAKDYYWETENWSDKNDLRGFIKWLEKN